MSRKYTGDLASPIYLPPIPESTTHWPDPKFDERMAETHVMAERIEAEKDRKMLLLFDEYGIERGDCVTVEAALELARMMASENVPGFQVSRKVGKKLKWGIIERFALVLAVDEIVEKEGVSISRAAELLSAQAPWRNMATSGRGLSNEYGRLKTRDQPKEMMKGDMGRWLIEETMRELMKEYGPTE